MATVSTVMILLTHYTLTYSLLYSHTCTLCACEVVKPVMSYHFDRQRFDRGDRFNSNVSHHHVKVEGLHSQIVGLHCRKVVVGDVQDVLHGNTQTAVLLTHHTYFNFHCYYKF